MPKARTVSPYRSSNGAVPYWPVHLWSVRDVFKSGPRWARPRKYAERMNALPRGTKKASIQTIRTAAGIAGGVGDYRLAAQLWALEAQLRFREEPAVNAIDELRAAYMSELAQLITHGDERSPTRNGVMRGLRRALELLHVPVPTQEEVFNLPEPEPQPIHPDEWPAAAPIRHDSGHSPMKDQAQVVLEAAGDLYRSVKAEASRAMRGDVDPKL